MSAHIAGVHPYISAMLKMEKTVKFEEAIDKLDKFELLDHVIVSKNRYYSFFEHGLIKTKNKY